MILNFYPGHRRERKDGKDGVARENLSKVHTLLCRRGITPPRNYTQAIPLLATVIAREIDDARI